MAEGKLMTEALLSELCAWDLLSDVQRAASGVPIDTESWAKAKGMSSRTIRAWRKRPEYTAELEKQRQAVELARPGGTVPILADTSHLTEGAEYRFAKAMDAITRGLEGGDAKFLQMYLQSEGKELLEAARAQRESVLTDLSDEELIEALLRDVPDDLLAAHLASRGWSVFPADTAVEA